MTVSVQLALLVNDPEQARDLDIKRVAAFKEELSALNRELLLQYLDLVDMLVSQPSMTARAVEAISTIVRNMHFLLNTLRCHQVCLNPLEHSLHNLPRITELPLRYA